MGQPAFELRELFERNNVAIYSSNHILYGDISRRIMSLLSYYSPDVEVYSIDEAFLRLDGVVGEDTASEYAKNIVDEIQRCIGVPVSVGVAATKTLAKIASRRAKKNAPLQQCVCTSVARSDSYCLDGVFCGRCVGGRKAFGSSYDGRWYSHGMGAFTTTSPSIATVLLGRSGAYA